MENSPSPGAPLSIESRTLADGAIQMALVGELDLATLAMLDQELDKAGPSGKRLILDLRKLHFIDSSGLHALLRVDRRMQETGGTLTIVRGPRPVERLFNLTGLDTRLHIVDPDELNPVSA
jgi:anti-sigma B factor antagonist